MLRLLAAAMILAGILLAADTTRPALLFREDFKETPAATPITQEHISGSNLILALYGPGKAGVKKIAQHRAGAFIQLRHGRVKIEVLIQKPA